MRRWSVLRGCCGCISQARPALRTEGCAGFVLATTIRAKHNRLQSSGLDFSLYQNPTLVGANTLCRKGTSTNSKTDITNAHSPTGPMINGSR